MAPSSAVPGWWQTQLPAVRLFHTAAEQHPPRPGPRRVGGVASTFAPKSRSKSLPRGVRRALLFFKPGAGQGLVDWAVTWLTVAGSRGARTRGWTCGDLNLTASAAPPLPDSPRRSCRCVHRRPQPQAPRSRSPSPRRPAARPVDAPSRTWQTRPLDRLCAGLHESRLSPCPSRPQGCDELP